MLPHAESDEASGNIHSVINSSLGESDVIFIRICLYCKVYMCNLLGLIAVPAKRSSHYIKGVLIGAMSMMGLALVMLLAFLWVCLLTKKERAAKRYKEVKKQVEPEASEI